VNNFGVGKGGNRNCFGKSHDPGKPALHRLGILPQRLRTSLLFVPNKERGHLFPRVTACGCHTILGVVTDVQWIND